MARSALRHALGIRSPTLLVHGADDPQCPPAGAERLAAAIRAGGTVSRCAVISGIGHRIPSDQALPLIFDFLEELNLLG
jgi:dipeptidyl aminopeptidase/acylaminoacyl peptidase